MQYGHASKQHALRVSGLVMTIQGNQYIPLFVFVFLQSLIVAHIFPATLSLAKPILWHFCRGKKN